MVMVVIITVYDSPDSLLPPASLRLLQQTPAPTLINPLQLQGTQESKDIVLTEYPWCGRLSSSFRTKNVAPDLTPALQGGLS